MCKKLWLISILIIFICGCSSKEEYKEKYSDYKRMNFSLALANTKTFYDGDKISNYAIADITEETKDEAGMNGLFYQIDNGEWILIKRIESCRAVGRDIHRDPKQTYFYRDEKNSQNKLFTSRCGGDALTEYILQDEKVIKKELQFDTTSISQYGVTGYNIEKVEDDEIYYRVIVYNDEGHDSMKASRNVLIKCSLLNYKCSLAD